MNDFPVSAQAMGGREVRNGIDHGEIYDHHFVEFTYANGTKMFSQCRHIPNCWNNVTEHAHGTSGYCDIAGGKIYDADGNKTFDTREADVNGGNGHQQEHHDLFADLRAGRIPNEAEYGAKSTMTAILGRMASYSGRVIQWDKALQSDLKLADVDNLTAMDNPAPLDPKEDGSYKIPVPGGSTAGIL